MKGLSQQSDAVDSINNTYKISNSRFIMPNEVKEKDDLLFLDTREKKEYEVSHIENAVYAGYNKINLAKLTKDIPKTTTIVVYCSVGVRSADIQIKLKRLGYNNVYNLYGGLFYWFNLGYPVFNKKGKVNTIHGYDNKWGKLIKKGKVVVE